jgi:2-oxoglutarate ferredoxin oxidoreductase subunit gamma
VERVEIRITGFGGQGVILAGYAIGRAFAVHEGRHATLIQSFGPEARGSSCSATLVLSEREIFYPYIRRPGILVAMSSEGYSKYRNELGEGGTLIYERDLVNVAEIPGRNFYGVPSTRTAESLGRPMVQNMVMVGFFGAASGLISREALREAVRESVPEGTQELNLRAFEAGWNLFLQEYGSAHSASEKVMEPAGKAAKPGAGAP